MKKQTLSLAIAMTIAAGFLPCQQAFAQQDNEEENQESESSEVTTLDRIEVTGSRIKRSDIEGALPVTVITREQIELSGHSSAADMLRDTTFNSFGSYRSQSGSSDQGTAQVNLRGLGATRTLVLIDGHRASKSGIASGVVNDLNLIPLAAIERIEILTDGASALYGSDAIGGVINVITRKDFEGAEISMGMGMPQLDGGDTEEASVVFGASGERGRILAGVAYNFRDIVYNRQRDYWIASIGDGQNFSTAVNYSLYGNTYLRYDNFQFQAGTCDLPNYHVFEDDFFGLGGTICAFDYSQVAAYDSSSKNTSLFANSDYQINDDWNLYSRATIARTESFGRYAPSPVALFLPADSPNNPTGVDADLYHRFNALGNRDDIVDTTANSFILGATGALGETMELDFGMRLGLNKSYKLGTNYVVTPIALQYLADGTYNVNDPFGNPDEVLNAMKATISQQAEFFEKEFYASLSGDLWEMGGGPVGYVIGGETRSEEYANKYDSLQEAGAIGGSAGNSAGGDREVQSAYFEVLFPLTDTFEIDVAGRYDRYSDYGADFSPKLALRWQPFESLTLRASAGKGFAAPDLQSLTQKESTSAQTVQDLVNCQLQGISPCPAIQRDERRIGNSNLESESSRQYSAGLAWQPLDWFNATLDYYDITINNRIAFYGAQALLNREFLGQPIPPGLGPVRDASGFLIEIVTGFGNEGEVKTRGLDLNMRTRFDLGSAGELRNQLQVSKVLDYYIDDSADYVGLNGVPGWRATLTNDLSVGDWTFGWNLSSVAKNDSADGTFVIGTYTRHDVQISYATPWNGKITLGVLNAGAKDPPLDKADPSGSLVNYTLYDAYGRVPYFRYEQRF